MFLSTKFKAGGGHLIPSLLPRSKSYSPIIGSIHPVYKEEIIIKLMYLTLFMIADAIYLFPKAGLCNTTIPATVQGIGNFILMVYSAFRAKISLNSNAGAGQSVSTKPDCALMKISNARS